MQVCAMSPMTMSRWMPCFLSCKSRSVLANPLEHQCSCATISPGAGLNFGVEFAAPGAVFKGLVLPCRPLDGHDVFPRLVDDLADCIRYRATITLLTPLKQALSDHLFDRVVEELSSVGQRGVGY